MRVSPKGLALIQRFEGFSPVPYRCPAGYPTIGYGHVVRMGEGLTHLSQTEALFLLKQDVRVAEAAVQRLILVPLAQGQFDTLVSFTFNLGAGALQRSTLRRVVNRGEHEDVPCQLLHWVFAGGRKLPGLVARRQAEAVMYGAVG